MSPEMMAKRHLLPLSGPQEPVSAAITTFVASVTVEAVITGAIIGAVTSAITGGDILKGALLGGLGGALTSGMGGVMEASSASAAMDAGAGGMLNSVPTEAVKTGADFVTNTVNAAPAVDVASQVAAQAPASAAGSISPITQQAFVSGTDAAKMNLAGSAGGNTSLTGAGGNTSIVQGAANNLAPTVTKGGTGLLSKAGDLVNKALSSPYGAAAAMQLGGAMLTGNAADKRAAEQAAEAERVRKRRATPVDMAANNRATYGTSTEKWA